MPKTFLLKYIRGCKDLEEGQSREPQLLDCRTDKSSTSSKKRIIEEEEKFGSSNQSEEERPIKRAYTMPPTPPSPKFSSESPKHLSETPSFSNNMFESSTAKYGTPHFPDYDRMISNNPLSQLAEISLSMAGRQQMAAGHNNPMAFYPKSLLVQQAHLASLMWPSMAAAALAANYAKDLSLTPSSSPSPPMMTSSSPPPAHTSPVHSPVVQHLRRSSMTSSITSSGSATSSPPPAHRSSWMHHPYNSRFVLEPPQNAPEDLRVIARKIDFQSDSKSTSRPDLVQSSMMKHDPEIGSSEESDGHSSQGEISNPFDFRQSSRDDVHECSDCGKAYSTSSNLARHRQTHRSLEDKKARKCPHCSKTYVSMPAYSMHLRTHNQGCKCNFCGKCFSRPWLLQGHIRTHTGEKPFTCNVCEKSFADKSNLRAHVQTHSNTKPFECSRCHKAFALKSYLYKHEESSCMKMFKTGKGQSNRRHSDKASDREPGEVANNEEEGFYRTQEQAAAFLLAAASNLNNS